MNCPHCQSSDTQLSHLNVEYSLWRCKTCLRGWSGPGMDWGNLVLLTALMVAMFAWVAVVLFS